MLGIIGPNGSGKTTLLRLIAGIYKLGEGKIKTKGKIAFLSSLGNGLNRKLTVKDNIFLVGSIMGISQKNLKQIFNQIIEFSGLKDFVNIKVHQLSRGMKKRLEFSITSHCLLHSDPDLLLFDEVFSGGGDEEFQNKSLKKMEGFIKQGKTMIIISHEMEIIKKYCDKVIWLEKGQIHKQGSPQELLDEYLELYKPIKPR